MAKLKGKGSSSTEGAKVMKDDMVEVIGTGANKFMAAEKSYMVHSIQAEKLIASGAATKGSATKQSKSDE